MSEFVTPKALHWIRDMWTYFYIVKAHANGSLVSELNVRRKVFNLMTFPFLFIQIAYHM